MWRSNSLRAVDMRTSLRPCPHVHSPDDGSDHLKLLTQTDLEVVALRPLRMPYQVLRSTFYVLEVNRSFEQSVRRFPERFIQRRMRMDRMHHRFTRRLVG